MILFALISGAMIVIILYTYYYLVEISTCPCFVANKKKELNVDYMKFYLLLDLISLLMFMFVVSNRQKGGKPSSAESLLLVGALALILGIHSYMTYNVYHFYHSVKSYCDCANQWQKYFVYYEGIFSGLVSLQYIFTLLLVLLIFIRRKV
jgi:hypothetical protein